PRAGGGIGRRARLRALWPDGPWRFKSSPAHYARSRREAALSLHVDPGIDVEVVDPPGAGRVRRREHELRRLRPEWGVQRREHDRRGLPRSAGPDRAAVEDAEDSEQATEDDLDAELRGARPAVRDEDADRRPVEADAEGRRRRRAAGGQVERVVVGPRVRVVALVPVDDAR